VQRVCCVGNISNPEKEKEEEKMSEELKCANCYKLEDQIEALQWKYDQLKDWAERIVDALSDVNYEFDRFQDRQSDELHDILSE